MHYSKSNDPVRAEKTFTDLYELHSGALYSALLSFVKSEAVAEDLLHDLFVKMWNNRQLLEEDQFSAGYLYTSAKHLALDYIKKRAIHIRAIGSLKYAQPEPRNTEQERLEANEYQQVLLQAIQSLPPQQRLAYVLANEQELSYHDIADKMNLSRSTVKRHLEIARRFVRAYVQSELPDILPMTAILCIFSGLLSCCFL